MSIFGIDHATSFGALDWDALTDGVQVDANTLRAMGRQANRLLKKRHQILSLVWPLTATTLEDYSQRQMEVMPDGAWGLVLPPQTMLKKPRLVGGTIYLRALVPNTRTVRVRAGTRSVNVEGSQEVNLLGTGSFAWYSSTIALDPGDREELRLYARTEDEAALMDTGTYGTPNSGTVGTTGVVNIDHFILPSGSHGIGHDAAVDGHVLRYLRAGHILAERRITGVVTPGSNHILQHEPLSSDELAAVRLNAEHTAFEIRAMTSLILAQVLVVTDERSF